jgi:hypothetical protein
MANELTFTGQAEQKVSTLSNERKSAHDANKLRKGNIVYKRDTGMAHKIVNVSLANGIEHYSLICSETNKSNFLSKFALENDYTKDSVKVEHFGLKMVRRLSEMCGK